MANESINWTEEEIARRQRELVSQQLDAMLSGHAPPHFAVVGTVLNWLKAYSGLERISLLDAGCASGYYSQVIEHYVPGFVDYTGLDFSPHMLEIARKHYSGIPLIQQDLRERGEIQDGQFQAILSGAVLMHIREWEDVLANLARIASKWIILHRTWLVAGTGPGEIEIGEAYGHCVWYITFRYDRILQVLRDWGFEQIHSLPSGENAGEGKVVRTLLFERRSSRG